jgi:hypothetical protein
MQVSDFGIHSKLSDTKDEFQLQSKIFQGNIDMK